MALSMLEHTVLSYYFLAFSVACLLADVHRYVEADYLSASQA